MKAFRQILSLLMVTALFISAIPVSAMADNIADESIMVMIRNGEATYHQNGSEVPYLDENNLKTGELAISKTAVQIGNTNEFEITLTAKAGPGIKSAAPINLAIVLDYTGSMGQSSGDSNYPTRLEAVRAATKNLLGELRDASIANNVDINVSITLMRDNATTIYNMASIKDNHDSIVRQLEYRYVNPLMFYTNIKDALKKAESQLATKSGENNFILLLTDGVADRPNPAATAPQVAIDEATRIKNELPCEIFSIYYSNTQDGESTIRDIASSPDHFEYASTGRAVNRVMNDIQDIITSVDGGVVMDPMGDYVTFLPNSISGDDAANATYDNRTDTLNWMPTSLSKGNSIKYRVSLDVNAADFYDIEWRPLNKDTSLEYRYMNNHHTMIFNVPMVKCSPVIVSKQVAEYTGNEPSTYTYVDDATIPYDSQAIFAITITNNMDNDREFPITDQMTGHTSITEFIDENRISVSSPIEVKANSSRTVYYITDPLSEGVYENVVYLDNSTDPADKATVTVGDPSLYYINFIAVGNGTLIHNGDETKVVSYGKRSNGELLESSPFPNEPDYKALGSASVLYDGKWFLSSEAKDNGFSTFPTGTISSLFSQYSDYVVEDKRANGTGSKVLNLYVFFDDDEAESQYELDLVHEYYTQSTSGAMNLDGKSATLTKPATAGTIDTLGWQDSVYNGKTYGYYEGEVIYTPIGADQPKIDQLKTDISQKETEINGLRGQIKYILNDPNAPIDRMLEIYQSNNNVSIMSFGLSLGASMEVGLGQSGSSNYDEIDISSISNLLSQLANAKDDMKKLQEELTQLEKVANPALQGGSYKLTGTTFECTSPDLYKYSIILRYKVTGGTNKPDPDPNPKPGGDKDSDSNVGTTTTDKSPTSHTTIDDIVPPKAPSPDPDNAPTTNLPQTGGMDPMFLLGALLCMAGLAAMLVGRVRKNNITEKETDFIKTENTFNYKSIGYSTERYGNRRKGVSAGSQYFKEAVSAKIRAKVYALLQKLPPIGNRWGEREIALDARNLLKVIS